MVYNNKFKFTYTQIPHTGSTSMAHWLKYNFLGWVRYGSKHSWEHPIHMLNNNWYRFTMVRNPYERMFTWYWFDKERNPKPRTFKEFMHFMIDRKVRAPLEECRDGPLRIPEFYTPQITWVRNIKAHCWLQLEDIPGALKELPFVRGKEAVFPHRNRTSSRPRIPFKEYFSLTQADLVIEHSKEDFEAFGYEI